MSPMALLLAKSFGTAFFIIITAIAFTAVLGIVSGLISAVGLILLSQKTFDEVYHLTDVKAPAQISNPLIIKLYYSGYCFLLTQNNKKSAGP